MARATTQRVRRVGTCSLALISFFFTTRAFAQVEASQVEASSDVKLASPLPPPPPTFAYTRPAEVKPLRAVAEIAAVLTVGFAWYATTAPTVKNWDPGYRWSILQSKLLFKDFGTDGNSFGTNFVGHPMGGTGYYLSARSNRLSIPVSFGLAVAGSLFWEMFGEISEVVSMNDMIVTPLAGIAIGEATTQLGAYFDRQAPTTGNRVLGSVFGPFKSMNDAFDGLSPDRSGAGRNEWHRFRTEAAFTLSEEEGAPSGAQRDWPEARISASSELVRLPGYEGTGHDSLWFGDGNASTIDLTATFGAAGLTDFGFATGVVLAGGYYRSSRRDAAGGAWGGNGIYGITTGFQYTLHQYRRDQGRAMDRLSTVQPLGVLLQQRGAFGGPRVTSSIELGPDFGGVTPTAIAAFDGATSRLPFIQNARGYYFAVGGHLRTRLLLESGPAFLSGELLAEGFRDVHGPTDPPSTTLKDVFLRYGFAVGGRVPGSVFTPRLFFERRQRFGWVGGRHGQTGESTLGAGLGATF